ncbi:MAG: hypothetical protein CSA97_04170 [Bacteroidetes bacterium]|nr:MAG: hypothetical protein CSA97_04170 [Bacteroidota bacterium]
MYTSSPFLLFVKQSHKKAPHAAAQRAIVHRASTDMLHVSTTAYIASTSLRFEGGGGLTIPEKQELTTIMGNWLTKPPTLTLHPFMTTKIAKYFNLPRNAYLCYTFYTYLFPLPKTARFDALGR